MRDDSPHTDHPCTPSLPPPAPPPQDFSNMQTGFRFRHSFAAAERECVRTARATPAAGRNNVAVAGLRQQLALYQLQLLGRPSLGPSAVITRLGCRCVGWSERRATVAWERHAQGRLVADGNRWKSGKATADGLPRGGNFCESL